MRGSTEYALIETIIKVKSTLVKEITAYSGAIINRSDL